MLAKEPIAAREDESSLQLRGRIHAKSQALLPSDDLAPSNVIALRRADPGPEELEARLRAAFDLALAEPLAAAKAVTAAVRHQVGDAQIEQMQAVVDALTNTEDRARDFLDFMTTNLMGGLRIARRQVDLKVLCERVLDAIQREHPERLLVFQCESRVDGEWDPDRIASLLSRLVKNAIQHGLPQRISVGLRAFAGEAVIEVRNQGPPLDGAILRGSFQPFASGRPPRSGGARALGLGLYLSREIVRAHGGRIDVKSDKNVTTVRITLPRSHA